MIAHLLFFVIGSTTLGQFSNRELKDIKPFKEDFYFPREVGKKEMMVREKLMETQKKIVDSACSQISDDCFDVVDEYFVGYNSNRMLAVRTIYTKHDGAQLKLTVALLQPPNPLTWNDLDSRKWEIRKEYIDLIYPVLMISNGFMTGTMKLLSKTTYNILLIGHGGGIISSFFSTLDYVKTNVTSVEIDPLMAEFAKKWFGYRESESQHLIIDDGLEYFKYAEKEGYKFDVIILDACPNQPDPHTGVFCPLKQMLDNPVLERMNNILAKNGTLIMNFIANMNPDLEKQVMKQASDVFKDCYKEHLNTNEAMITCSNDMGNNPTDNEALFNDRYKKLRPYLNIVPFHAEKRYQESLPKELKSNRIPKVEDWARDEL